MTKYYLIADDDSIEPIEVFPTVEEVTEEKPMRFASSQCDVRGHRITGLLVASGSGVEALKAYAERLERRQRFKDMEAIIMDSLADTRALIDCMKIDDAGFYSELNKAPAYGPMRLTAGRGNAKRLGRPLALPCRGPPLASFTGI